MKKQKSTIDMADKQRIRLSRILLEPVNVAEEKDHWIHTDNKTLDSLLKGIQDAEEGHLQDLGLFSKYTQGAKD